MTPFCLTHTTPTAPQWCDCDHPQPVTAYGWTHCGHCHRGTKPEEEGE